MLKRHKKLPDTPQNQDAIRSIEQAIRRRKINGMLLPLEGAYFKKKIDYLAQLYRTNPTKFKEKMAKI